MKAVILAAGKGTRMMPLTETIPKVLVQIKGKPFLWYLMQNLKAAGITDIALVVGYKKEAVARFLEEYSLSATLLEQKEQRGTGDIGFVKTFTQDEPFLFCYGDGLWSVADIKNIMRYDAAIGAKKVSAPEKYGVLVTKEGVLDHIVEKPSVFVGNLINTGLYLFPPAIFSFIDSLTFSPRGELEITDAITFLAKQQFVNVIPLEDSWLDLGSKEDIPLVEAAIDTVASLSTR